MSDQYPATSSALPREARLLAKYLVPGLAKKEHLRRYTKAVEVRGLPDSRALRVAMRFPLLLGVIDAGCGFLRPNDALRQRLLVMAAILEASPAGVDAFMSRVQKPGAVYWICFYAGCRAGLKAVIGIPLVFLMGRGE